MTIRIMFKAVSMAALFAISVSEGQAGCLKPPATDVDELAGSRIAMALPLRYRELKCRARGNY